MVKDLPGDAGDLASLLGQDAPLEKMATHSQCSTPENSCEQGLRATVPEWDLWVTNILIARAK